MFSHLARRLFATTTRNRKMAVGGRKRSRVRLHVEDLEGKLLMTAVPINFGATVTTRSAPVAIGGELFFTADEATHGNQVWETNGTVAGTVQLSDGHDVNGVNGGIFPSDLTAVGNEVFFSATTISHGYQIWETNGTAAGTQMVSDIDPGNNGIFPTDLTAVGNTLYFVGYDANDGMQLFESNGTAAGTQMVADIPGAKGYPGCYPTDLTAGGGLLYFVGHRLDARDAVVVGQPVNRRRDDADVGQRDGRRDGAAVPHGGGRHGVLLRVRPDQPRAAVVERRYGGDDGAADVGQRVAGAASTRRC